MAEGTSKGGQGKPSGGKPPDFDLLEHNLGMATAIEASLRTAYGPGGRSKLFQDEKGTPRVTARGVTILEAMDGNHPVLRTLAAAAAAQEEAWGDGTKLAPLLALRLLVRARELLEGGLRPPHVVQGYEEALAVARAAARDLATPVDPLDGAVLQRVGRRALGGVPEALQEDLTRAAVAAVQQVTEATAGGPRCDRRDVHLFPKTGSALGVEFVPGYVLRHGPERYDLPKRVVDARIALLDAEPKRGKAGIHAPRLRWLGDSEVQLTSPGEIRDYEAWADGYTEELVDRLRAAGANVVLCRLGISRHGHRLLADAGILAVRRLMKGWHMDRVARATGASRIKDFKSVRPEDLGRAGLVEERRFGDDRCVVITDCANPRIASLVLLAPGETLGEELKEEVEGALGALAATVERPLLVPGGGAVEMAAARAVREAAPGVGGRAQLAVEAFALALEDLPALLAANLGLDPVDVRLELRSHHAGGRPWGVSSEAAGPARTGEDGLEPLAPRLAAWERAVEVCRTILRVDDVHKVSRGADRAAREGAGGEAGALGGAGSPAPEEDDD